MGVVNRSPTWRPECTVKIRPGGLTLSIKVYDKMDGNVDLRLGSGVLNNGRDEWPNLTPIF